METVKTAGDAEI